MSSRGNCPWAPGSPYCSSTEWMTLDPSLAWQGFYPSLIYWFFSPPSRLTYSLREGTVSYWAVYYSSTWHTVGIKWMFLESRTQLRRDRGFQEVKVRSGGSNIAENLVKIKVENRALDIVTMRSLVSLKFWGINRWQWVKEWRVGEEETTGAQSSYKMFVSEQMTEIGW